MLLYPLAIHLFPKIPISKGLSYKEFFKSCIHTSVEPYGKANTFCRLPLRQYSVKPAMIEMVGLMKAHLRVLPCRLSCASYARIVPFYGNKVAFVPRKPQSLSHFCYRK